jgi:DivIVA domain-containing protein
MTWFFAVLIVLAIGAVAVVASGRGGSLGPAYDDRADVRLPADAPVTGADLRSLRFNTAVRGYRASEVDALLERLAAQLDQDAAGPPDAADETSRRPGPEPTPGGAH